MGAATRAIFGLVKVNVDAVVARHGCFGTAAAICRDGNGVFQGASAILFKNIDDPEVLETLAICEALALSDDLYLHKNSVASDCKVVVEAIKIGTLA